MILNLKNFERIVESKIVDRGFEYYEYDNVVSIEHVDEFEFCAVVLGSMEYVVYVRLNDDLDVLEHSCDCPYDWGDVCKHKVAVFYYIKDAELYDEPVNKEAFKDIMKRLKRYDKDELFTLFMRIVKRNEKFRQILRDELGLY